MKHILVFGAFLIILFILQYFWFVLTMDCVVARAEGGIQTDWAVIQDCSY